MPKADFLMNPVNKYRVINMLAVEPRQSGVRVVQYGVADVSFVKQAVEVSAFACVIGEDTDLLVYLQ